MNKEDTGLLSSSNALLGHADALRARLREDGYLYLQQVLDSDRIQDLRQDILQIFQRHGWLLGNSEPDQGLTNRVPVVEGEEGFFQVYDEVQKLESFHAFSHHAQLMDIIRQALGSTAFPHPLGIARLGFPNNAECTTPPHQDYPNNQGSSELCAAWVPLGDCPASLGGLAILEKSNSLGLLPLEFSLGAGARQATLPAAAAQLRWLSADYQCGDVLLFGSTTVHCSLPNASGNRFRLSVDYRYQEEGKALTARVLEPHFGRLQWSEIYREWQSTDLQYYWRDKDYLQTSWDDSLHQLPDEHLQQALAQARAYNARRMKMAEDQ